MEKMSQDEYCQGCAHLGACNVILTELEMILGCDDFYSIMTWKQDDKTKEDQ